MRTIFVVSIFVLSCSVKRNPIRYIREPGEIAISRNAVDTVFEVSPKRGQWPQSTSYSVYNKLGKVIYSSDTGVPVRYYYDQNGIMCQRVMENPADSTEGIFDAAGNKIRVVGNLTDSATMVFDLENNTIKQKWKNVTIVFRFDGNGFLVERQEIPDGDLFLSVRKEYRYDKGLLVLESRYLRDRSTPLDSTLYFYSGDVLDSAVLKHDFPHSQKMTFDKSGLPLALIIGGDTMATYYTRQRGNK